MGFVYLHLSLVEVSVYVSAALENIQACLKASLLPFFFFFFLLVSFLTLSVLSSIIYLSDPTPLQILYLVSFPNCFLKALILSFLTYKHYLFCCFCIAPFITMLNLQIILGTCRWEVTFFLCYINFLESPWN